jgi:ABC-2 type transport system permease protein
MWRRIIALIQKELLGVWRDPKTRTSLLVPPLIQLVIFASAATLDVKNVPIGILNLDHGKESYDLLQRFRGSTSFNKITFLHHQNEIAPFIDRQKGVMVVSIDEQFSRDLEAGKSTALQLILDGRKSNTAQIVAGYAGSIVDKYNREFAKEKGIRIQNAQLVQRNWFNPNLIYSWYNIPSLVSTLSMLTCLVVTSISVARERELGTFDQLLVSPMGPVEIVIGKIIPGIIVGLLEATLMIVAGSYLYNIPFTGSILLLYLSLFVFISSVSGIGLFISSMSKTQQQAMLGTFTFLVPSILLSGFATPVENMPAWLQPVTYLIPLKYMLVISKGIFLKAMPFHIVWSNIWPMIFIGAFNLVGATIFFRRRLD